MNPHGLFHPEHQTTPYEMALITREALKIPEFRKIVSATHYPRPKTNMQEASLFAQGNKLLRNGRYKYSKAIGVKTGYHSHAEHTFIGAAQDGDRILIAVLMRTKERSDTYLDAIHMFETAFAQPKITKTYFNSGAQLFEIVPQGSSEKVKTCLERDLSLSYYPAEEPQIKCFLEWEPDIKAPIRKGQQVGSLKIQTSEGKVLASAPLLAENHSSLSWTSWILRCFGLD